MNMYNSCCRTDIQT